MKILRKCLLLCILITLLSGNVVAKSPMYYDDIATESEDYKQEDDPIDYRLPTDIKPISYDIKLIPKLQDDFKFKGYATIKAVIIRATNNITLHVGNTIEIESVAITLYDNIKLSSTYDNITEKYTITSSKIFKNNRLIQISFEYNGILSDKMVGFYRSSYFDENGQIKWLAASKFQKIYARQAFPCFDEPSFKAKFTLHVARDENYISLSNMPLAKSEKTAPDGKIWDTFEETVPMSPYLVAFVISDFKSLKLNNFRVWSKPSTVNQAKYALDIGTAALELFTDMFQQRYVLPKMDMIAIPDFVAGAMENWGLVTYRETQMLYDEKESSALAQQRVASVVVHELAHMWFGNLITPEWWSYLWLSEAFARYFQYFGTAELEKSWHMKEQFVVDQFQSALITDGLESSLPMTRNASTKSQILETGGTIIYAKGASIVRMMSLIFGSNVFKTALQDYISNNKEKGLGHPDTLWNAIKGQLETQRSSNIPVKAIMDTWTTQSGYPVVSVNINDDGVVNLSQERFFLRNLNNTSTNVTWYVPLTFATQSNPDFSNTVPKYWFNTEKTTAQFKINPEEWAIFNLQSSGFYRVNYDDRGWQRIFDFLKSDKFDEIHVLNRAAIIDDLLSLGRAGYQNKDLVLDRLLYLKRETNYLPFKAALNGLGYFNKRFAGSAEHNLFKRYVLSLIDNIRSKLGYEDHENDDRLTVLLRQEVNKWACNFNDDDCVATYIKKFSQWRANPTDRIKVNERTAAYCVAIRYGSSSEDWEFLWNEYFNSNYVADQMVILNALGCSQNTTILEKYLKYAITRYEISRIRNQDSKSVFAAVYNSGLLGAEFVLDFVDKYYKEIEKYFGEQSAIATILKGVSQHLSSPELINKFEEFINNHKQNLASIQKSLKSSLRVAKYELEWYKINSPSMIRWLQKYNRINEYNY